MRSTSLLMVASAIFGSSLAIAQSAMAPDTEKAKPAALATLGERFAAADADGDGALTRDEAERGGLSKLLRHFDRIDADADGKITREEMRKLLRHRPTT